MTPFELYCITCPPKSGQTYEQMVKAACKGGSDIIQFRAKELSAKEFLSQGKVLAGICKDYGVLFFVNDRPDIALALQADGVHLGQDDVSIELARTILGSRALVGRSTHSLSQALEAQAQGADYIGVGPIFSTPTKPDYKEVGLDLLGQVSGKISIPFAAIGGIDLKNVEQVLAQGAQGVAVVRGVCGADDVEQAARLLKDRIRRFRSNILVNH